jgi:L-ascorbate 6-phosphate lactonase
MSIWAQNPDNGKVKWIYQMTPHDEWDYDGINEPILAELDFDGIKVYHTGDTAYQPEYFRAVAAMHPEVLIPCINGRYGNLNSEEAALLTRDLAPKLTIASHFWMFVAHNGDPASFLEFCAKLAPEVEAIVMKAGERLLFQEP